MRQLTYAFLVSGLLLGTSIAQAAETATVFAAASLKNALDDAGKAFTGQSGIEIKASYAASSALARQIESGAPADLFASADLEWMDDLAKKNLIKPDTKVNLLRNRLVVVTSKDAKAGEIAFTAEGFSQVLGTDGRIATGEVSSVPAGKYAKAAFEKLGMWPTLQPRLAMADNVRAALALVSRGEAPLGVVYESDAKSDPGVKVIGIFPNDSHPPIIYPFAVTADAKNDGGARFLDFLKSPAGKPFFEAQGFGVIEGGEAASTR